MSVMTAVNCDELMRELESLGTEQFRKTFRRHAGTTGPMFGVSFAHLGRLKKRIKVNHDLAEALWATGNLDARMLACMIADPGRLSEADLDRWIMEGQLHGVSAVFISNVVVRMPGMAARHERWIAGESELIQESGWDALGQIATRDTETPDSYFLEKLAYIEQHLPHSLNRVRHEMNNAVIAIGLRNADLEIAAKATARRIGKVIVDHGDTDCKTPDAIAYIDKVRRRKSA